MGVYYDGGVGATLGVDFTIADEVLTWISATPWVAGQELQVWYKAA